MKAENAGRRCRELESGEVWTPKGIRHIRKALERKQEGKSVEYRWIPQEDFSRNNAFRPEVIEKNKRN